MYKPETIWIVTQLAHVSAPLVYHRGLYAKTLLNVIFPQGILLGVFQGDFGILKQTLTRLRKKSQGDFQGSKIATLRSFYSS